MSRALARLRGTFEDPLFVRGPRGMLPTPRAVELAPEVEALLERARALVSPSRFDPATLDRTFTIVTSDLVEQHLVAGVMRELIVRAPRVDVRFLPLTTNAREALSSGVDLAIGVQSVLPQGAMSQYLFDDAFLCAVRQAHPTVGKRLGLDDYVALAHIQIAPRGTAGGPVDDALAERGLTRRVAVRTHSFLAAPLLASRSDFVLTAPWRVLLPLAKTFRLRTFPPPLPIPGFRIHQAWHARVQDDPAHRWFRGIVASVARGSTSSPVGR